MENTKIKVERQRLLTGFPPKELNIPLNSDQMLKDLPLQKQDVIIIEAIEGDLPVINSTPKTKEIHSNNTTSILQPTTNVKPAVNTNITPEIKPATKTDIKQDPKPAAKTDIKQDPKPVAKKILLIQI